MGHPQLIVLRFELAVLYFYPPVLRVCMLPPDPADADQWSAHHHPAPRDDLPHPSQLLQPRHYKRRQVREETNIFA